MEPITNMDSNKTKKKVKIERLVLDINSVEIGNSFINQLKASLPHIGKVSLKDAFNFVIKTRSQPLSVEEINLFQHSNMDDLKIMKLAMKDIEAAQNQGIKLTIAEALKKYQTLGVNSESSFKKTRGRKKKINTDGDGSHQIQPNNEDSTALESSKNSSLKNQILVTKIEKSEDVLNSKSP